MENDNLSVHEEEPFAWDSFDASLFKFDQAAEEKS